MSRVAAAPFLLLATTLLVAAPALAQDDDFAWENETELSFVTTGGNASSSSFGLKSSLTGEGGPNGVKLEVGGIRAQSDITTRTATGTVASPTITKTTRSELTAASYFARGRYDRALDGAFVFGGVGWDRNTFSGIENRFAIVAGFGKTWIRGDSGHLKTDLGATYTIQKDVEPEPGADDAFGGLRASIDAARRLTETTNLTSVLIADENVEDTKDLRADWTNSVAVAISEGLALKTSLQLLFDNKPAALRVPLLDSSNNPTGMNVRTPGDKLDRVLTLTLVIKL